MPYITKEKRGYLSIGCEPKDVGELNFCISKLVDDYLQRQELRYATINEVIGVLECAKQELYRRVAAGYEDDALLRNGEVYYSR